MVQGGDPTGTGTGGESIYGPTFPDEIDPRLLHDRRGVLAMANSGKNTNGSQFYILYKSAAHLNFKHTVFGAVVGGLETLSAIEDVKSDSEDRPLQRIEITGAPLPPLWQHACWAAAWQAVCAGMVAGDCLTRLMQIAASSVAAFCKLSRSRLVRRLCAACCHCTSQCMGRVYSISSQV
jgi:Cyclophilin type peptidyl-prolyl cis-trans isomerase/CLD